MARIPLVEFDEADRAFARSAYGMAEANHGFTPNLYKVLAHRPEIVHALVPFVWSVVGPTAHLHPNIRDLAVLKTSKINGCGYCVAHRTHFGKQAGLVQEKIDALDTDHETCELYDERTRAAISYADALTRGPSEVSDELFERLRSHFSVEEIVDLTMAVSLFNLFNRIGEGLKVEIEPHLLP